MAVSADQTAGSELDAAEIARDDDDRIREAVFFHGLQNRIAGSSTGLAVIVGFLQAAGIAENPGRAIVAGVKIFLFHLLDEGLGLVLCFHGPGMGQKPGFLYFIAGFPWLEKGLIFFHRQCTPLICFLKYSLFSCQGKIVGK